MGAWIEFVRQMIPLSVRVDQRRWREEVSQGADEGLIVSPTADGAGADLLPHLPLARRDDGTIRRVKIQTSIIPRQSNELEQP
jgi:hypothetical protein